MSGSEKDADLKLATENIKKLENDDVILASYLGSGSSLMGGILLELGLDYIEGYQEKISENKRKTDVVLPLWRKHWRQLEEKYMIEKSREVRFFKTHFYPESYVNAKPNTAVLLVRDARDAVISYYNWRRGFSDEKGSLSDFLNTKGFYGKKPFDDWTSYIEKWIEWGNEAGHQLCLVKYEDLKFNPLKTIKNLLKSLKIKRTKKEIENAVENSRFSKIKSEEMKYLKDKNQPRIFRKGLVGEWKNTLQPDDLKLMKKKTLKMLEQFQYSKKNKNNLSCFNHWFIGYNRSTRKYLKEVLNRGEKAVLICLKQQYRGGIISPNLKVITGDFLPEFLDMISGNIYISSANEEIMKSVENIAKINNFKLVDI